MTLLLNYTAIEFPGTLKDPADPSRALEALGGEQTVRTYVTTPPSPSAPRLALNLRPTNDVSQSNILAEPPRATPNLFLIQITTPVATTVAAAVPTPETSKPRAKLVARVSALTEFRALSDFQYQPSESSIKPYLNCEVPNQVLVEPDAARGAVATPGTRAIIQSAAKDRAATAERVFHALTKRPASNLSLEQCLDRLRPIRFARPAPDRGTTSYWYRQYGFQHPEMERVDELPLCFRPGRPLGDDGRSQPDRLRRLPHRVSYAIDSVPKDAPTVRPPVYRGRAVFAQLVALLRLLFQKRPVWVRRALLLGVPPELRANFKKAIACVAYSFQGSGAFFQACVKYGYDPRQDSNSRKYQVLEVRCGHPLLEAVRLVREQQEGIERRKKTVNGIGIAEDDMKLENQKAGTSRITLDLFRMPAEFILKDVPRKKNNFFQICDIQLDEINEVINKQPILRSYDSKNGFFTDKGMANVMESVKETLFKHSKIFLGQDRSKQLLRGDFRSVKMLRSKKRGRLHLKDVMRPEDAGAVKLPGPGDTRRVTRSAARKQAEDEFKCIVSNDVAEDGNIEFDDIDYDEDTLNGHQVEEDDGDHDGEDEYFGGDVDRIEAVGTVSHVEEDITPQDSLEVDDDDNNDNIGDGDDNDDNDDEEDFDDGEELAGFEVYDSDVNNDMEAEEDDIYDDEEADFTM